MKINDSLSISDSVTIINESNYIFYSNKKKVTEILNKEVLDQNDIIDVFIGLHIVLELGINNIFRKISSSILSREIDIYKINNNIDNINFINKVVMFVYYSKFNFPPEDTEKIVEYHSIIGKLRLFSEMRNKLLHGHSIVEILNDSESSKSELKKNLNGLGLLKQLKNFKYIIDGFGYYLDHAEVPWAGNGMTQLKKTYLEYSFIPDKYKI